MVYMQLQLITFSCSSGNLNKRRLWTYTVVAFVLNVLASVAVMISSSGRKSKGCQSDGIQIGQTYNINVGYSGPWEVTYVNA
jgi:hypothetical protein